MTDFCYFDYNASTPLHPEVLDTFNKVTQECFGNPASPHALGQKAQKIIEATKDKIAEIIGCLPQEIWFTSGGTESNNWLLKMLAHQNAGKHFLVSAVEHKSILKTAEFLDETGQAKLDILPVGTTGSVEMNSFQERLKEDTFLVSTMLANNETGLVQPIEEMAKICRQRSIFIHTDAVGVLGKSPINFQNLGVDAISFSGHKLYAPKGVGVLIVKEKHHLEPLIHGCGQQNGMRSGTENVAAIAAFGKAFELMADNAFNAEAVHQLTTDLITKLKNDIPVRPIFHGEGERLPNTISVAFSGFSGQELLQALSQQSIYVSAGAAANTGDPSHVLKAMGIPVHLAQATLRISLGWGNTKKDVSLFMEALSNILKKGEAKSA